MLEIKIVDGNVGASQMHRKLRKIAEIKMLPIKGRASVRSVLRCILPYYVNEGGEK